jgi:hypothetical protein
MTPDNDMVEAERKAMKRLHDYRTWKPTRVTPDDKGREVEFAFGDAWELGYAAALTASNGIGEPDRVLVEALRSEIINTPETADFMAGVPIEAAHQRERWGASHDAGKTPFDWFWLVGYLAQKAATAAVAGNHEKAMHHTISTAAALANWHAALNGNTEMRPGIGPGNGGDKPGSAFDLASKIDDAALKSLPERG